MTIAASDIRNRIIEAIMAQKLAPGARLGEQQLAMLFDCSRTIVRETLMRLATRGWHVIEPSQDGKTCVQVFSQVSLKLAKIRPKTSTTTQPT